MLLLSVVKHADLPLNESKQTQSEQKHGSFPLGSSKLDLFVNSICFVPIVYNSLQLECVTFSGCSAIGYRNS